MSRCSATALTTINAFEGYSFLSGVSQNMNILFHAPATVYVGQFNFAVSQVETIRTGEQNSGL